MEQFEKVLDQLDENNRTVESLRSILSVHFGKEPHHEGMPVLYFPHVPLEQTLGKVIDWAISEKLSRNTILESQIEEIKNLMWNTKAEFKKELTAQTKIIDRMKKTAVLIPNPKNPKNKVVKKKPSPRKKTR